MAARRRRRGAARLVDAPVDARNLDPVLVLVVLGFALDTVDLQIASIAILSSPVEVKLNQETIVAPS